jgi:ABC-type nitrate/sulfonate/bicarbonate transport system ATPase subunit
MQSSGQRPLLTLELCRIARPDNSEFPALTAHASGQRLALVGAWGCLFQVLLRELRVVSGIAEIGGVPLDSALRSGRVGLAPLEPSLPARWSFKRYLSEAAALRVARSAAANTAKQTLRRFGLESMAERPLGSFRGVERRMLSIVHATLGDPEILAFETPLARLDDVAQEYLETLLERAIEGKRAVISVLEATGRERRFLDRADTVLRLDSDHAIVPDVSASTSSGRQVLVTVTRRGREFRDALMARGMMCERVGPVEALSALLGENPPAPTERFSVVLSEAGATLPVFAAANEVGAPLVELVPVL